MTLGGLLGGPPAIVAAGVDVFSDALRAQGAEVHDVDWRPPGFGDPADLAALALNPRRNAANRVAVERILAAGSQLVDVRPARGDRPAGPDAAALRSAADLGDRLRPDAWRADRGLPLRGLGRRRRGRRGAAVFGRDHARPVPPPPDGRSDGRGDVAVDVDVVPQGPGSRRGSLLQPERGPGQG